jgi:ribonuclease HI
MIRYTDGGCSGNDPLDLPKRKIVAVVSDEHAKILIDKHQEGGSNNIAELLAVNEALLWCSVNRIADVEIRTDSMNNLGWVFGKKVGKKVNDRDTVLAPKNSIDAYRQQVNVSLNWIPRARISRDTTSRRSINSNSHRSTT